jgi:lipopolysaccharide transport system ATP-binding protein
MVVRLGFAVATAMSPDLLVTDEILAVGDESFQKKCLRWMEGFRSSGGTLLLCSHSMYHIQTLCQKTLWIHEGRTQMQGETFAVTQAYLAHHETKNRRETGLIISPPTDVPYPIVESAWLEDGAGSLREVFDMGEDIQLCGIFSSPEDHPTVIMVGIARIDGTPVFGTSSSDAGFTANRLGLCRFGFRLLLSATPLLPGMYHLRAHTLDEHGLRMFDTREIVVTIKGQTRDHGLVRLNHRWLPGSERKH